MKLEIHTIREVKDKDIRHYFNWLNRIGCPVDGEKLLRDGEFTFSDNENGNKATTTYRIIKES